MKFRERTVKIFNNILFFSHGIGDEKETLKQALKLAYENKSLLKILIISPPFPDSLNEYKSSYEESIIDRMEKIVSADRAYLKISLEQLPVKVDLEYSDTPAIHTIRYILRHSHDLLIKNAEECVNNKGFKALDMDLLRKCPCPLFLSKPSKKPDEKTNVAVAVDPKDEDSAGKSLSLDLLQISHSLAKNFSGNLDIISCWNFAYEDYLRDGVWIKTSEEKLNKLIGDEKKLSFNTLKSLVKEAKIPNEAYNLYHLKGYPQDIISSYTSDHNIDILIMGTVARTGLSGFIIGNTAENILQQIDCSLLALKPKGFVSPVKAY
jgi:nucleotide-binding universal stress UspA family protein